MIDAVLLDVGGVFVMPDHQILRDLLTAHGGAPTHGSLDHAHYHGIAAAEDAAAHGGEPDWHAYRRAVLQCAGLPDDRLEAASSELELILNGPGVDVWKQRLTGAAEGLAQLAELGIPIAMVSNSDGTAEQLLTDLELAHVRAGEGGAGTPVDIIIDSHLVGVEKPDPAIFALALEATKTLPERTVHVGDTLFADVVGAFAAGLRPLHLDPIGWCPDQRHEHVASLKDVAELVLPERES